MKVYELKKILTSIEECEDALKHVNIHGLWIANKKLSNGVVSCLNEALCRRRINMIDQLKDAGVVVDDYA